MLTYFFFVVALNVQMPCLQKRIADSLWSVAWIAARAQSVGSPGYLDVVGMDIWNGQDRAVSVQYGG